MESASEPYCTGIANKCFRKLQLFRVVVIRMDSREHFECDRLSVVYKRESMCPHFSVQYYWKFDDKTGTEMEMLCEGCGLPINNANWKEVLIRIEEELREEDDDL